MKFHFVIHEAFEGAGYFEYWLHKRGYQSSYSRVYLGQPLPNDAKNFDCLIILGGPQNPSTSIAECSYFDSAREQALIRNAHDDSKAVIGVCLGAQLIGEALGAQYEKSPQTEIGYFPIKLTLEGINDPLLEAFGLSEVVGHWHKDMPGLTDSAKVLAVSEGCPRQIICYSDLVYGFQCHLEFINSDLPDLIEQSSEDFSTRDKHRLVQSESRILDTPTSHMNQLLGIFLDKLVATYLKNRIKI
ncbi:type 1 glutamine amidotransferase [Shewanella violacea]|uniref:Glutamine amidotransferase class-I, putative n=1 Tax=Shewanella violacea (strain JCM 10179 / CIP 106290 / LMG 19151 / DSS12) TaxID=637905 RepID=D4ZAW4_SHEVD|nr:type 1 glutamine amidotransferase [Shewanella violacea]BAJ03159.1 glutamine amidotransferase class-I, putative [Shewanella violacea DSS12]